MSLFTPDNFSIPGINFKKTNLKWDPYKILDFYFSNYKIIFVGQLDRLEINSENYKIILRIDDKEESFLLRKHLNSGDSERINFYLDFLLELNMVGVPVSQTVLTSAGKNLIVLSEGIFSVFGFIDGKYFSSQEEEFISTAKMTARMHLGFNSLNSRYLNNIELFSKQTKAYYNEIKKYSMNDFGEIECFIGNKKIKTTIDLEVLGNSRHFFDTVAEIDNYKDRIRLLPKQIIHSDLHPHNLLIKDGKVKAILDFDAVRISEQARDVASAVYRFGRQFLINKSVDEAKCLALHLREVFLENYSDVKQLSTAEIDLMPILLKDEFARKLLFVLKSVYLENKHIWAKDLPKFIAAFKEIDYFWPN